MLDLTLNDETLTKRINFPKVMAPVKTQVVNNREESSQGFSHRLHLADIVMQGSSKLYKEKCENEIPTLVSGSQK